MAAVCTQYNPHKLSMRTFDVIEWNLQFIQGSLANTMNQEVAQLQCEGRYND